MPPRLPYLHYLFVCLCYLKMLIKISLLLLTHQWAMKNISYPNLRASFFVDFLEIRWYRLTTFPQPLTFQHTIVTCVLFIFKAEKFYEREDQQNPLSSFCYRRYIYWSSNPAENKEFGKWMDGHLIIIFLFKESFSYSVF